MTRRAFAETPAKSRADGPLAFTPARWLPGRHLQTIVPALLPAGDVRGPGTSEVIPVSEDASLRVELNRAPDAARGTVVLIHGIGGSSRSGYMRRMATRAYSSGWSIARVNCRNCGGTESLSRTLYNAGQSEDLGAVMARLDRHRLGRPFALVGFSLGGAMALRYAGGSGADCLADAVVAVSPPVDLDACCRALERRENTLYHTHFTLSLLRLLRRIRKVRHLPGPDPRFRRVRTLRRLDAWYTAPDGGYRSVEEYYREASALPFLGQIRVPSLLLFSENDPFVPKEIFAPVRRGPPARLRIASTPEGGHLGFWNARTPRFWAGEAVMDHLDRRIAPARLA